MRGYRVYPGWDRNQFQALRLIPGDLITEIDGVALSDPEVGKRQLEKLRTGTPIPVAVERKGQSVVLSLELRQPTREDYRDEIGRKDLWEAARDGDLERVRELIEAGEDIEQTTSGMTALQIAVRNGFRGTGQAAVVELLISRGARIDATDEIGRTLLVDALTNGAAVVEALLDAGIDVNAKDNLGRTALSYAVSGKDDEVFDLLLQYGADATLLSDGGSVVMQSAISNRHLDRLVKLLDSGVDVNAIDRRGQTALFAAVDNIWSPTLDVVQLLLDRGATANIQDHYGDYPLKLAQQHLDDFLKTEKRQMKEAKKKARFGIAFTPEQLQQRKRDFQQIVALLKEAGGDNLAPVDISLLYAARIGDFEMANDCLRKGENIDAIDSSNGYSPLIWALQQNHEDVADKLLDGGADPDIVANYGETALMVAIEREASMDTIRHLLDSGADPNLETGGGTALMIAALSAPKRIIKLLLDYGADPNIKVEGYTAAYAATMAGRQDVVDLLIAAGAE
jgi:ankyrin repeat protein